MKRVLFLALALALAAGCVDNSGEWRCEIDVNGVDACVDTQSRLTCDGLGGEQTPAEVDGTYTYCEDAGYTVECDSVSYEFDGGSASYFYNTTSAEDCTTSQGE